MYENAQRVVTCAAGIAAIGLAGCGASASIHVTHTLNNPDKVVASLLHPAPKSVKCPSGIADKTGTKFTCKVVAADGKTAMVAVLEYRKEHIRVTAINGEPVGGT